MGILPLIATGSFFSISDAGTLKVCDTHKGHVINESMPTKQHTGGKEAPLKAMIPIPSRNIAAIADSAGNVFLVDTRSNELEVIKVLRTETGA